MRIEVEVAGDSKSNGRRIEVMNSKSEDFVWLSLYGDILGQECLSRISLSKSQARSIGSALMGCAAELGIGNGTKITSEFAQTFVGSGGIIASIEALAKGLSGAEKFKMLQTIKPILMKK